MTTAVTNGHALASQVRQLLDEARQAGDVPPGRPTLAKKLGVSEHKVRVALASLGEVDTEPGDANTPPLVNDESPAEVTDQLPAVDAGEAGDQVAEPAASPGVPGKVYSILGFIFGSVTSVAFNVLAARIPPEHAPQDWQPSIVAQVFAGVWPLALLISIEVISRISWPTTFGGQSAKYGGSILVALPTATISYQHIQAVLLEWQYNSLSAGVGPLVLDGLMVLSGFGMLVTGKGKDGKAA